MATQISLKRPAWVEEFQAFIMKGNVVDLAVGIIIGAAFTSVVGSLVKDLFTPLIGLLVGGIDFSNIFITLKGASTPTLEAAKAAGAVTLNVGLFLNAVIQFLIVGFAVFWMVKALSRLSVAGQKAAPPPTKSELLLVEIRDLLAKRSAE
jgi:large conductance mechanosensitive channel